MKVKLGKIKLTNLKYISGVPLAFSLFLNFFGCFNTANNEDMLKSEKWSEYDIGSYIVKAPSKPLNTPVRGIDSNVGKYVIGDSITLSYDIGMFSSSFREFKNYPNYYDSSIVINEMKGIYFHAQGYGEKPEYHSGIFFSKGRLRFNLHAVSTSKLSHEISKLMVKSLKLDSAMEAYVENMDKDKMPF